MKYLRLLPLILLSLFLFGCPDKDDDEMDSEFSIVNNSDKYLFFINSSLIYPDTMLGYVNNPFLQERDKFTIKPNSIYKQKDRWRAALAHEKSTGIMTIFLFDKAVIDSVSWDKIREDYLVAKRYEYTLKQLDSLNWTITYP